MSFSLKKIVFNPVSKKPLSTSISRYKFPIPYRVEVRHLVKSHYRLSLIARTNNSKYFIIFISKTAVMYLTFIFIAKSLQVSLGHMNLFWQFNLFPPGTHSPVFLSVLFMHFLSQNLYLYLFCPYNSDT